MSDCRQYQELLEDFLAGEIVASDLADLRGHCDRCRECAELLELHEGLLAMGEEIPEPDQDDLDDVREAVLERVSPRTSFRMDLGRLWRAHPVAAGFSVAAALACAVFLGRWSPVVQTDGEDQLLAVINQQAARQSGLEDYWNAPLSFANVTVRPQADGQLALSFDVSRHLDVQAAADSPLAREVLMHAILEPSSLGSRFGAMDVTPQIMDRQLEEAVAFTMHNDPSLTVRLNALAALARYPYDGRIQDAMLQTLKQDSEVQMRLLALEHLTRQHVGQETIRNTVYEAGLASDVAVLQHLSAISEEF